jgi:hypothetical protein
MIQIRKLIWVLVLFVLVNAKGFALSFIPSDTIVLSTVKQKIQEGSASDRTLDAYHTLLEKADQLLSMQNPTVMDKTMWPPSGDKHDYLSISRYWWPNPDTADGLPWIRKDGETNPETQTDAVDRKRLGAMTQAVKNLSLAYFFSEDERYAQKAAGILKNWFLDTETRMNPHLEYAQSVPGYSKGRSSGILDGRSIASVVPEAITILSKSSYWTQSNTSDLTQWLSEYLKWLIDSELGNKENNQKNNHGSWYKYQVAALAMHLGNDSVAKETVVSAQESLSKQLDDEGKQTHELARTRSFFYSCFNLDALTNIALVGDCVGMDMWNYASADHKSLLLAVNYLAPVINGEEWNYTEIHGVDLSDLVFPLFRMAKHTNSNEVSNLLAKTISVLVEKEKSTGIKNEKLEALSLLSDFE